MEEYKKFTPLLAILPLFTIFWFWIQKTNTIHFTYAELESIRPPLQELLDLIGSTEGEYDSVTRGFPGDTPPGWVEANLGKPITQMRIKTLRAHQGGRAESCWFEGVRGEADLYAVGRYQLIPCTLQLATKRLSDFDMDALFDNDTQDVLGVFLLIVKRPKIREYLVGYRSNHQQAAQELAREFSSVPLQFSNGTCKRGQSFRCDRYTSKVMLDLPKIDFAFKNARKKIQSDGTLGSLLREKENTQTKIHRWWDHMTDGRK